MRQSPQPDPDLTIFLIALNGAHRLWMAARRAFERRLSAAPISGEVFESHLAYLDAVRAATVRLVAPPGGEAALRALLALIDGQIAVFRARQAEDEAQYEGHKLGVLSRLAIERQVGSAPELPRLPPAAEEYLRAHVVGQSWCDQLSLAALALTSLGYSCSHICKMLQVLHRRFLAIAAADSGPSDPATPTPGQLAAYVRGLIVPEDSLARRDAFVRMYWQTFERTRYWLTLVPPESRELLGTFLLPEVDPLQLRALLRGRPLPSLAAGTAQQGELWSFGPPSGEAIALILSAARSRHSHLCTVYLAYQEAIKRAQDSGAALPLELPALTLQENGSSVALRLHLWDRQGLCDAFPEQFSDWQRQRLQRRPTYRGVSDELFLEVLSSEDASERASGPWYVELLKRGVFGNRAEWGVGRHLAVRQQWLRSWGYSSNSAGRALTPFATTIPGLLAWPNARSAPRFIEPLQRCLRGALIPAGSLAAAASFGLLALELYAGLGLSGEALLEQTAAPTRLLDSLHTHVEALQANSFDTLPGQRLFCYDGHALASADLAACLRFVLHGISYDDGGQRRTVDGHGSRRLIDAMLGISPSRPRKGAQPSG
jgi:hypothetical protein